MAVDKNLHLGKRLRNRRLLLHLSQVHLANAIGVTFQQIQKYESGTSKMSATRLWDIADALDVPISYFFEGLPRMLRGPVVKPAIVIDADQEPVDKTALKRNLRRQG